MNGRAFDPELGRFLSVDPLMQAPLNSQSLNPYSYVMNNPIAGTDPTGYASTSELGAGSGIHPCTIGRLECPIGGGSDNPFGYPDGCRMCVSTGGNGSDGGATTGSNASESEDTINALAERDSLPTDVTHNFVDSSGQIRIGVIPSAGGTADEDPSAYNSGGWGDFGLGLLKGTAANIANTIIDAFRYNNNLGLMIRNSVLNGAGVNTDVIQLSPASTNQGQLGQDLGPAGAIVVTSAGGLVASLRTAPQKILLYRRGPHDSQKLLQSQAKAAQEAENISVHGVSVSTNPAAKAGQVVRCASRCDVEEAGFVVHKTGSKPDHYTVELPNPVTSEIARKWNELFQLPPS